ncbi:Unsaturated rhamnogalacturonyl hydrolase YteR [Phytophthora nicotianae]|uniref:Unsaturated rhamnogalacturonyl hydrolase YteR n=1 Tax=Phytophthora nicotianae TaxID=4792 RepID=A0A0W8DAG1_PHYNI|nr:Unsaturated rhamnogalacturonyl hydrolase YteR [Phytophthora nicotianae]
MGDQPRLRLLLLAVALLAIALLSTAEDASTPVTPAVQGQEHLESEPVNVHAQHGGHDHDHNHHDHDHEKTTKPNTDRFSPIVWGQALFATALVGAAPVLVLLVVPLGVGNQEKQQPLLRVFLSFAAGGLLGDALLHLLPHSLPESAGHSHDHEGHDHDHEGHSHSMADLYVWLWTLAGMLTFFMLEKFVRAQTGGGHGHSHGHAHPSASVQDGGASPVSSKTTTARKRTVFKEGKDDAEMPEEEPIMPKQPDKKPIAAAGYLNLAADFSHNFTDGLAIGATFLRGTGWTTTVAMLLHELPHEIGDFAILIQSGFTRREAMITQLLTAIGAMIGTVIGLLMEGAGTRALYGSRRSRQVALSTLHVPALCQSYWRTAPSLSRSRRQVPCVRALDSWPSLL